MNRIACKYAILRFMPYPETGEFANVGIVAVAPKRNQFEFVLEMRRTQRLTQFFTHLDRSIYKDAISAFHNELAFLKQQVTDKQLDAETAFSLVAQPRETMLAFSQARGMLGQDDHLKQVVEGLFADYAEHEFAKHENYEAKLQSKVRKLVKDLNLKREFVQAGIEERGLDVKFELAQLTEDKKIDRVIKPLSFRQDDANKVYKHADTWLSKLRRLKEFKILPNDLIFPFDEMAKDDQQAEAIEIVRSDFAQYGDVIAANDETAIKSFAES